MGRGSGIKRVQRLPESFSDRFCVEIRKIDRREGGSRPNPVLI